jgi:hypothetical protein
MDSGRYEALFFNKRVEACSTDMNTAWNVRVCVIVPMFVAVEKTVWQRLKYSNSVLYVGDEVDEEKGSCLLGKPSVG